MENKFLGPILTAFALFFFAVWGIHFEAYEAVVNAQFNGELLGHSHGDMYIYSQLLTPSLFPKLYQWFSGLPVFTIFSFLVISISLIIYSFSINAKHGLVFFLVLIACGSNVFWISNLRLSIISVAIGALHLLSIERYKILFLLGILLALYGSSVRYESGLVIIVLVLIFAAISGLAPIRKNILGYVGATILLMFIFLKKEQVANQNTYLKTLHHLTYLTAVSDIKTVLPNSNDTTDLFLESLNLYAVSDSSFFNQMSHELPKTHLLLKERIRVLLSQQQRLAEVLSMLFTKALPEMWCALVLGVMAVVIGRNKRRIVLANMLWWGALFFVLAVMKAEIRFASPYLFSLAMLNLLLFPKSITVVRSKLLIILLVPGALLSLHVLYQTKQEQRETEIRNRHYLTLLNARKESIIALNMNSVNIFNTGVMETSFINTSKKIMPVDMGDFVCISSVHRHIKQQFGINSMNPKEVFQYLSEHNTLYLSSPERVAFMQRYLKLLYDFDIVFKPVKLEHMQIDGVTILAYHLEEMADFESPPFKQELK